MKVKSLRLTNFKGIKSFNAEIGGANAEIYGDNATGKTTLCDALYWLLFDKDSNYRSQFEIKTLDASGEALHGLDHDVEAAFLCGGETVNLKKSFKEIWTKKRGDAKKTFTGHTTDYFVDGVPVKKKEYSERTGRLFDEEQFKLLTTPNYFAEILPWKQRRELLLGICGDVSLQDVIDSNPDLKSLELILSGKDVDDQKAIIASKKKEINKELDRIPVRIDEVKRGLPDIAGINPEKEKKNIEKIKSEIAKKEKQIIAIESGGGIAEKEKQLSEIEARQAEIKNTVLSERDEMVADCRKEFEEAAQKVSDIMSEKRKIGEATAEADRNIERLERSLRNLRSEWKETNGREFTPPNNPENCPTCGQKIPEEQREKALDAAMSAFNLKKSEELQKNKADGVSAKTKLDAEKAAFADIVKEGNAVISRLDRATEEMKQAEKLLERMKKQQPDLDINKEYADLESKKIEVSAEIEALKAGTGGESEKIKAEIERLSGDIEISRKWISTAEASKEGLKRIEELEEQERVLSSEFEKLEGELFLIENFIRSKVELLEGKINSKFKLARFKLFKEQINEGLAECCEVLYNGVPYNSGLNNGARINVGLDIIGTLSEFYKTSAPIFIDNAEAVTEINAPEGTQIIKMIVSEKDKELRIETE